jgi:general stress protein 26
MNDMDRFWDLASRFNVAMLVTLDKGRMRARPLALHLDRPQKRICFLTRASAHKVKEAAADKTVCIIMADPAANLFLSVSGEAQLSADRKLIRQFWDEAAAAWFASGPDNPDVAVITVEPRDAEYWEEASSSISQLWQLASGAFGKRVSSI